MLKYTHLICGKHTVPNCIIRQVATNFSHFSDNYKHNNIIIVCLNTAKLTLVTSGVISTAFNPVCGGVPQY